MQKLTVSPSPHVRSGTTTSKIMLHVMIGLTPALFMSVYFFGGRALMLTGCCMLSAIVWERLCNIVMKKPNTTGDLSAAVTGMILAFNLPVTLPYWMAVIGSFVAIVIVKQLFGGLGQNFANPAITARIVLMVSFPAAMTKWTLPFGEKVDAVSAATPLKLEGMSSSELDLIGQSSASYKDLFLGTTAGCLGETCALALLIGGLYLAFRRIISLSAPVAFIGSLALLTWVSGGDPLYHILAGGVFLGAFFMATDYATTPITEKGKIICGLGCGIITFVIRRFGSYPEGVSFSILLMNVLTPYIELLTRTKVFGAKEAQKNEG